MPEIHFEPAVTISATYGAGGSVLAPALAERLGLAFVDRMISDEYAGGSSHSQEHLIEGEEAVSPVGRFLTYFARAASVGPMVPPDPLLEDDDSIRERSEKALVPVLEGQGAVVLGRAGAVVLASRPRTLHVRLDGDRRRRIEWAAAWEAIDTKTAESRLEETDKARTLFVKRLYRADPTSPSWYHLVLDPTVFGTDRALELLVAAARAFFEANP